VKSVVVVGAGAFGGWTALQLLQRRAKVTLVDAWGPGNSRASSGGETRIIRATYGPATASYAKMVARALDLWQEYQRRWNLRLFFRTGALWMAGTNDSFERASLPSLAEAGIRVEQLSVAECAKRWPQVSFNDISWGLFEPDSGYLAARRSCEAVLTEFTEAAGDYREAQAMPGPIAHNRMNGITVTPGDLLSADEYVFACGPWLPNLFPILQPLFTVTRQEVFFFGTPAGDQRFTDAQLPVWIDGGGPISYYGIPGNHWRGFKLADDTRGVTIDPTVLERQVSKDGLTAARAYLRRRFPALGAAPLIEARVCQYENSTDRDFILDRHPQAENVWIVGGGSGHGFKHAPVIGEMVADAVLGLKPFPQAFSLQRFG
jgi:glycine/D-amino acid oxidase-like deaminating enzyme